MDINRRNFLKLAAFSAAAGPSLLTARSRQQNIPTFDPLNEQGIHPVLDQDHSYIFVDSCMQIWPDARLEEAHRYGVTAFGLTAWDPHMSVDQALEGLMSWHLAVRKYPNLSLALKATDFQDAKKAGKALLLMASQCGDFIGYKLHRIEAFTKLGLRMLIPAYSLSNHICGGCLDLADPGLTSFGRKVVEESNRVGLLLDCSHLGKKSSLDIINLSRFPVVFSHSCTKALAENPRNIDNEQIKACASRAGVIGLSPWGPMVLKTGESVRPTVEDFIDHIDHVAQLLGSTDNIGVGTDMSLGTYPDHAIDLWGEPEYKDVTGRYNAHITDNIRSPMRMVEGFSNYAQVLNFAERLKRRGYKEPDISAILGENYRRIFSSVWI